MVDLKSFFEYIKNTTGNDSILINSVGTKDNNGIITGGPDSFSSLLDTAGYFDFDGEGGAPSTSKTDTLLNSIKTVEEDHKTYVINELNIIYTSGVNIKNEIDALENDVTGLKKLSDSRAKIEAEENNIKKTLQGIKDYALKKVNDEEVIDKNIASAFPNTISKTITTKSKLITKLNKVFTKIHEEFTERLYKVIDNFITEKLGSTIGGEIAESIEQLKVDKKELDDNYTNFRSDIISLRDVLKATGISLTDVDLRAKYEEIKIKAEEIISDINKMKSKGEEYRINTSKVYNSIEGIIQDKTGKEDKEKQYAKEKTVDKNFDDMNKSIGKKRKTILALIIINVLITLVLIYGAYLVINNKSISLSEGLKVKNSKNISNNKMSSMSN